MFSFLKKFFDINQSVEVENGVREFVIFDGDQTSFTTLKKLFIEKSSTKFVWVQSGTVSKKVISLSKSIELIKPSHIGKEATDTQIGISIVVALTKNSDIKTVYIVSTDGDFYDVVMNISREFPSVKFVIVNDQNHKTSVVAQTALRKINNRNKNCFYVKLKR